VGADQLTSVDSIGVVAAGRFRESLTIGGTTVAGGAENDSVIVELSRAGSLRTPTMLDSDSPDVVADIVVGTGDSTVVVGEWLGRITLDGTTYLSRADGGGGRGQAVSIVRLSSS